MNKDIFDVLDNADNETIERLSSFTDDDDEVKKRILNMSERKYQNLKAGLSENESKDKKEITMSVADKRPVRWYKPLAAVAAVAVIIAGVTMITNSLDKYTDPSDDVLPAVQTETDSPVQSEAVTDSQSSEQPTDHTTTDTNLPSEDEMKELYAKFADFYSDINDTLISKQYELVSDGLAEEYKIKNRDNYINVEVLCDNEPDGTHLDYYYEFNDDRFSTLEEFNNYYSKFFNGTDCAFKSGKKYGKPDEERLLSIDETLEEFYKNGWLSYLIMECDNKLYISEDTCFEFINGAPDIKDYFSEHSFEVTENSFRRIRLSRDEKCIYATSVLFNKKENNTWEIADVEFNGFSLGSYWELGESTSEISDIICYLYISPNYGEEIMSSPDFETDEELIQIPEFDETITEAKARDILIENGLHHRSTRLVYSDTISEGYFIKTVPDENSWVLKDTFVDIYISRGKKPDKVKLPDVYGKSEDEASKILRDLGLFNYKIHLRYTEDYPDGVVIDSNYQANDLVDPDTAYITLYVSSSNPDFKTQENP